MELSLSRAYLYVKIFSANGNSRNGNRQGPGLLLHLEFSSFTGQAGGGTNIAVGADEQNADLARAGCWH
jgi:hypothetical protein